VTLAAASLGLSQAIGASPSIPGGGGLPPAPGGGP
jgi:hypothetical protein